MQWSHLPPNSLALPTKCYNFVQFVYISHGRMTLPNRPASTLHYSSKTHTNTYTHLTALCPGLPEYMKRLMNEENEWDHKISAEVKEGPADCIRMDEVRAALKKMKRHKAPGLSGLVAEMIHATGDIGTQWILDLCNGIVKEGSIPGDWKSGVVVPIYKGKGDPMECGSYRGIKLLEHATKGFLSTEFGSRLRLMTCSLDS